MSFAQAVQADRVFEEVYQQFVAGMPQEWKADRFFLDHTPILVSMRYGQNEVIAVDSTPAAMEAEAHRWNIDRRWDRIRTFNYALATHIRYVPSPPRGRHDHH